MYILYKFNCSVVLREKYFFSSSKNCDRIIILGNVVLRSIKGRPLACRLRFLRVNWSLSLGHQSCFPTHPSPPPANPISKSFLNLGKQLLSLVPQPFSSWFRIESKGLFWGINNRQALYSLPLVPGVSHPTSEAVKTPPSPGPLFYGGP